MTRKRTVKECLVNGGVRGIKFVGAPEGDSCVYEIKRIEQIPVFVH